LSNLSGDIYIGFMVPVGVVNCTETSPGIAGRSFAFSSGAWTTETADFHFRAVFAGPTVNTIEYGNNIDFRLFPNPANDLINVSVTVKDPGMYTLEITDLLGKKVIEQEVFANSVYSGTFDVSALNNGVYIAHMYNRNSSVKQKLVVR